MNPAASSPPGKDGRLWALAFGLSVAINAAAVVALGLAAIRSERLRAARPAPPPPPPAEAAAIVFEAPAAAPAVPVENLQPKFARTAADQAAERPNRPTFIGERDTRATSDRAADASAPPLPSQAGLEPLNPDDLETTESDYQDGELAAESPQPAPEEAAEAPPAERPAEEATSPPPPGRLPEKLATSSSPVDVPVRATEVPAEALPEPREEKQAREESPPAAKARPIRDPAFAGFQQKKAIVGSISRTGRSALDVADSPLGRYQATISRAVELEWQRNCVRHRDFITPGYLTIRFFVEPSGRVRTVQFVGEMETGEVQKGFTLNSIREAKIPPMPPAVRKEFRDAPLELLFNFYF